MPPRVGAQRPPDSSSDMTSPPETAFTEDAALDEDEFDTQSLPALAGWVVGQLLGELDHGHLVLLAGQFVLVRHYRSPRNWKRITPVSVGLSFLVTSTRKRVRGGDSDPRFVRLSGWVG